MATRSTPGARLRRIVDEEWQGNQRLASRTLGISPTAISQLIHDQRSPSFAVVQAIFEHSQVDLRWFISGEGVPYPGTATPVDSRALPLAEHFLLGSPQHYAADLPSLVLPDAATMATDSRYLVRLRADEAAVRAKSTKLAPGDLCLVETDSTIWQSNPQTLRTKHCVVRLDEGARMGRVAGEPSDGQVTVRVYAKGKRIVWYGADEASIRDHGKERRGIALDGPAGQSAPAIVGVILSVWRS